MRKIIIPKPLSPGDTLRIIAPSCSGKTIKPERLKAAVQTIGKAGFKISFSKNLFKFNEFQSSDIKYRLKDLHDAFADPKVKGIIAIRGGFNCNDLLDYINWDLIKNNPKVYCGYSDNTALQNAILSKTGLLTYSGPNFSTFGNSKKLKFTLDAFLNAVSGNYSEKTKNDKPIVVINKGKATGRIVGGNLCTLNLLQGSSYMPSLEGAVLFLEDDHVSDLDVWEFQRNFQSLINLPDFSKIKAVVFGAFEKESKITTDVIRKTVKSKPELNKIPAIANVSFGHVLPIITFPIGGWAFLDTTKKQILEIKA